MFIKICGLTNVADALAAWEAGADAVGFVLAPSVRAVTVEQAREIGRRLPTSLLRVGVYVSPDLRLVKETMATARLDLAQIHGEFPEEGWQSLGQRAIRAVRVGCDRPSAHLTAGAPRYLLLDACQPGQHGGTGRTFPWAEAAAYRTFGIPLLLAGGLNPDNIQEAMATVRPAGVDVSSGVECSPGRKDHRRMIEFVAAVRQWETKGGAKNHEPSNLTSPLRSPPRRGEGR